MNDPSSPKPDDPDSNPGPIRRDKSFWKSLTGLLGLRNGESARDALEELIDEVEEGEESLGADERRLLGNVLELHNRTVEDVMVPRVDVIAVRGDLTKRDLIKIIIKEGHSRLPVYTETLDDANGMVHVKDVLAWHGKEFRPVKVLRPVLHVPHSMKVLELLLEMRINRCHMALVVDEFGGVDGLVTIEDLVEEIVGEIEDEFDPHDGPAIVQRSDGSWDVSARAELEDFEDKAGQLFFSDDEKNEIDTLGGLVFAVAGRVPVRGELLNHPSGLEFEVLEVDPRRIKRMRVRTPERNTAERVDQDEADTWKGVDWAEDLLKQAENTGELPKPETKPEADKNA